MFAADHCSGSHPRLDDVMITNLRCVGEIDCCPTLAWPGLDPCQSIFASGIAATEMKVIKSWEAITIAVDDIAAYPISRLTDWRFPSDRDLARECRSRCLKSVASWVTVTGSRPPQSEGDSEHTKLQPSQRTQATHVVDKLRSMDLLPCMPALPTKRSCHMQFQRVIFPCS